MSWFARGKIRQRLRQAPGRLVNCLAYALVGLAALVALFGIVTFISGNVGSLNRWLDSGGGLNIFGSASYWQESDQVTTLNMMRMYFATGLVLIVIASVVLSVLAIMATLTFLSYLGRRLTDIVGWLTGCSWSTVRFLAVLITWTLAVVGLWSVLNIPTTIYYLLGACGLLLIDLGLTWLELWLGDSAAEPAVVEETASADLTGLATPTKRPNDTGGATDES